MTIWLACCRRIVKPSFRSARTTSEPETCGSLLRLPAGGLRSDSQGPRFRRLQGRERSLRWLRGCSRWQPPGFFGLSVRESQVRLRPKTMAKKVSKISRTLKQLGEIHKADWDFIGLLNTEVRELEIARSLKRLASIQVLEWDFRTVLPAVR